MEYSFEKFFVLLFFEIGIVFGIREFANGVLPYKN